MNYNKCITSLHKGDKFYVKYGRLNSKSCVFYQFFRKIQDNVCRLIRLDTHVHSNQWGLCKHVSITRMSRYPRSHVCVNLHCISAKKHIYHDPWRRCRLQP